jgi:subtilisin
MRRSLASAALSVLLSIALVVPAIAADPSPSSGPSGELIATPSLEPTPVPDPSSSSEPTADADPASPEPTISLDPTPSPTEADPTPSPIEADPTATPTESDPTPPASDPRPSAEPTTDDQGRPIATGRYIVILSPTADTAGVITRHRQRDGIKADRRFERAVRAFSAKLDAGQRRALLSDPNVAAVVPDEVIGISGQVNPTGVSRVGARLSATAAIDNVDERVNADVAIVDTGIAKVADLNVVGGVNCSTSDRSAWRDENGHGTHVAGTVAAIDNEIGVVGVAPGARVWAVRILNADGYGLLSWYVCGLDWILGQRDPVDSSRPLIEAVNMSVAKSGSDDQNCGITNKDVLHQAICRLYKAGITVVAAAANEHQSASNYVPAAYNEPITVSALADTDGRAGGLGGNRCYSWGTYDVDDTFADFSNYGSDIDLIAPGKCIWSTLPGGYGYSSGTSMAAPAVTGAVALYKSSRPKATPFEVRESLRYLGNLGWATSTDPDSAHEPLLDVRRVATLGSFSVSTTASTVSVSPNGGDVTVPVTVNRSATFFERVRLSVTGLPTGWSATFAPSSLFGWSAKTTNVTISVPATAQAGRYTLKVVGTNWGRTSSSTITLQVGDEAPFTDIDDFKPAIDWLYTEGITGGCTPTKFCPKDPVTRIQMAMFLTRTLDLPTTTTDYFDDDDGMTGEGAVNAMRQAGLTAGCGSRRYCPTRSVTRIQMAMFLARALKLPTTTTDYFDDDDGMTGEGSVNALRKAGLTAGCGTRRFCPSVALTREQMAALLYRSFAE